MKKLLVIGNGFDLAAGGKTSYAEFFSSEEYRVKKGQIERWIKCCKQNVPPELSADHTFTCWDLLFCLESGGSDNNQPCGESIRWCDIESVIRKTLLPTTECQYSWNQLWNDLKKHKQSDLDFKSDRTMVIWETMRRYLHNSCPNRSSTLESFYEWLMRELIEFEKSFGEYIKNATGSAEFRQRAKDLLNLLCGEDASVYIDSFNYSSFDDDLVRIRHINGDCEHPIFGVAFTAAEEKNMTKELCFSKTSRRLWQDTQAGRTSIEAYEDKIDEAIIFGHSLNEMDYDYFNYLFSLLKFHTLEPSEMGSVTFAFSIYDEEKEDDIRRNHVQRVYKMLDRYESVVSKPNHHILVNLLRFSGKLRILEIAH